MVFYSNYTFDEISSTVQQIADVVLKTTNAPAGAKAMFIRKKYEDKKFSKISKLPELKDSAILEQLASGIF